MAQIGGVIGHGTADLKAIAEQYGAQLGHQLFAGGIRIDQPDALRREHCRTLEEALAVYR